jgi:hypothetical protein
VTYRSTRRSIAESRVNHTFDGVVARVINSLYYLRCLFCGINHSLEGFQTFYNNMKPQVAKIVEATCKLLVILREEVETGDWVSWNAMDMLYDERIMDSARLLSQNPGESRVVGALGLGLVTLGASTGTPGQRTQLIRKPRVLTMAMIRELTSETDAWQVSRLILSTTSQLCYFRSMERNTGVQEFDSKVIWSETCR